jgi:hypothetical protein
MPQGTPFFIGKNQVTFQDTIFLLLHALCVFLGASIVLVLIISFVLFSAINGYITSCFFWRRWTHFSFAKNTLVFTLIVQWVFSFTATAFSFWFSPWFVFRSCYIFSSRCIFASDLYCFSSKEVSLKIWMMLEKRKSFMQKSGTRRSLCRLWLRLLHVVLDIILIVCLVVLL